MKTAIISVALLGLFIIIGGSIAGVMYLVPLVKKARASHQSAHYYEKASGKYVEKDYRGAIEDLDKAIEAQPSAELYYLRASARQNINDMQGARDDTDKAIELKANSPEIYGLRAFVTVSLGRYQDGIVDFNTALSLSPQDPEIFRGRAMAEYCMGDNAAALKDYQQAATLAREGENASYAQYFIWCTQVKLGNAAEATKALTTFMETSSAKSSPPWTKAVGEFLIDEKSETELLKIAAAENLDSTTKINQQCEAYYYIAMKRLATSNKDGAREYIQKCIDTNVFLFLEYEMAKADIKRI